MKPSRIIWSLTALTTILLPFLPLFLWSFSNKWFYPELLPVDFGLRAWIYVFGTAGGQVLGGLFHSFAIALITTLIALLIGVPAGRALGLYNFAGKKLVALLLILPVVVPPLSVSMGLHLWFIRLGLAETYAGVVLVHLTFCLPYATFVMWGVFSDYSPAFEQQARSLGASRRQVALQVMLPMILPGIWTAAMFSFLLSWSQYLSSLIIGGGRLLTLPILLFSLVDSGDRPVAAAVSLVFIAPALLALLTSARHLGRQGLTGVR